METNPFTIVGLQTVYSTESRLLTASITNYLSFSFAFPIFSSMYVLIFRNQSSGEN